jgi:hypothetical protein
MGGRERKKRHSIGAPRKHKQCLTAQQVDAVKVIGVPTELSTRRLQLARQLFGFSGAPTSQQIARLVEAVNPAANRAVPPLSYIALSQLTQQLDGGTIKEGLKNWL